MDIEELSELGRTKLVRREGGRKGGREGGREGGLVLFWGLGGAGVMDIEELE